ncbi:MAG: helix-turn-helix transcriptional regulator [Chloroflexota bacterium]
MTRHFEDFLNEQLQDEEFAAEYHKLGLIYQVAGQVIRLRQQLGYTQAELAERVGTKQSGISRLENASSSPSLSFLLRVADALNAELEICFRPKAPPLASWGGVEHET